MQICYEAVWTKRNVRGTHHILDRAKVDHGGSFSTTAVEVFIFIVFFLNFYAVSFLLVVYC